jgi:hypothetical protein
MMRLPVELSTGVLIIVNPPKQGVKQTVDWIGSGGWT